MIQIDIAASGRNKFGKGAARQLRRTGLAPAILYGPNIDPVPLKINVKDVTKTLVDLKRQHAVINLKIDDKGDEARYVMLKEVQVDPVHDTLKHLDFYEISLEKIITLKVPLKFVGKAIGLELGGRSYRRPAQVL
jgi:large subunit ribosomal protein L25